MGILSNVGFACKAEIATQVETMFPWVMKTAEWVLCEKGNGNIRKENGGSLFFFEDIKWYTDHAGNVKDLCDWLKTQDSNDYLLIEACPEYPESGVYMGEWLDNPWNLRKVIRVDIKFEGKVD